MKCLLNLQHPHSDRIPLRPELAKSNPELCCAYCHLMAYNLTHTGSSSRLSHGSRNWAAFFKYAVRFCLTLSKLFLGSSFILCLQGWHGS